LVIGSEIRNPVKKFFSFEKRRPLQEVINLIQNKYVDDVKMSALSDTAIMAALHTLDPHSIFIPAEDLQAVNEDIAGNFFRHRHRIQYF
jgi:carboxyl-terminal processing protease